ncbi:tRNA (adenosine(37)-N6)-threonylcarbamoyltransferase complex dimerization subunit type 1 TsaB [Enterobacteriaceae endosymbiont of Plateumaris braccata]|uniref:tRNA (adenosine(37)-N6)-threonylcarbamoyltransferase complex dimerization subunit type 1 TsaB n=1 Tax=Enterobacteriaceae endosymbiont of Plateumaris braccata TaxID=2675793 RepID=UPI001449AB73|nr:tRNA (adenosine(37)-N6)-threonylcarbamoyltransferase complex dimerization subunit type 1 TsaB [Enterobacteriaceae endosymbiont of Plateumaris braccata]QJC28080.1 tRNA (adenosine(37)-N6)-threonylcarbamoyltransferase complex dimerization subunit type 1 TsaB [Enterobacteriaceae endosymbiont of Plateumaris braccata]
MYKNILAIDTTNKYCSVTLFKKKNIFNIKKYCPNKHTKYILLIINDILKNSKMMLSDINLLVYNSGPGNFSSMRVGITVIEGLSYSLNIDKIGLSHLMMIAEQAWIETKIKNIITTIKYNKTNIYFALYKKNKKGLWIGKKSECIINNCDLIKKLLQLKGKWILVSDINNYIKFNEIHLLNKNLQLQLIKDVSISSKSIINIIKNLTLNNKKIYNNINYINNIF